MMMFTQRIWIAVNGVAKPKKGAPRSQDRADVGGELEAHELDDVVVDGPPFLDRTHDRGELVVGQHQRGRLLGHFGAGDAHRHADVGGLQRRRVVNPVAGHRHDMPLGLQGFDDTHLVLGRDAREHRALLHEGGKLTLGQAIHLAPS